MFVVLLLLCCWELGCDSFTVQVTHTHIHTKLFTALLVPPVLSSDGTVLYQVGASTELYCIEAESGRILWKEDGGLRSVIVAEPRLVERADEDAKLYVIESMTGELRQHDALTGDIEWRVDCNDVTGIPSCSDAVEADFRYVQPNTLDEL